MEPEGVSDAGAELDLLWSPQPRSSGAGDVNPTRPRFGLVVVGELVGLRVVRIRRSDNLAIMTIFSGTHSDS